MIDIASLRLFFIQLKQVLVRPYIKVSLKIVRTLGAGGGGRKVFKKCKSEIIFQLVFMYSYDKIRHVI